MGIAKKVALGAVLTGTAIGMTPGAASAWTVDESWYDSAATEGAAAFCELTTGQITVHDDVAKIGCFLQDTLDDGYPVYISWKQNNGTPSLPLWNTAGVGSFPAVEEKHNTAGSFVALEWQVCRALPGVDNCSNWVTHYPK